MDGIETLDKDTLTPPEARIKDVRDARKVIDALKEAERKRSPRRAKLQGMLDGNPPYNPNTLRSKGQAHRTNLNLREAEGMLAAAATPYYDLVFEVAQFAEIYLEYGDNPQRNLEWGNSIAKRYDTMLDDWRGMDFHFQLHINQMCYYGAGPLMWEDAKDWRSKARKQGQFLVSEDTMAMLEELETLAVPRSIMPGDLYQSIKKEDAAATAGWKVKNVKKAIVDAAPEGVSGLRDWEDYQAQIRAGDVGWNARSKRIFVYDLFQKEFNGKVSHYILLDNEATNTGMGKIATNDDFLFKKIGRFDCFDQIICPFFFDVGTGEWHSIKGQGPKIYDFCEVSNRVTGEMVDGARVGSGILLEAADANALQTTQIVHIGGGVVVQPGYKVVQSRIAESLQGPLAVKRDLQNTLQSNTGQYRQRVSEENQEPTLGQAQLNTQQQAVLGKGSANRYYKTLDSWHKETIRRAIKMGVALFKSHKDKLPDEYSTKTTESERAALKFVQGCVADGVPLEALDMEYICSIKATRAVGYGSAQMQDMIGQRLMQFLPLVGEEERTNIIRRVAANLVGQANVDSIKKPYGQEHRPGEDEWDATVENNDLRELGGEAQITDQQNHVIHFGVHFQSVQLHLQQLQNGQSDTMKLLIHIEQAGPHMTKHLVQIEGDPSRKEQVNQMREAIVGLAKLADQLKQQMKAAQDAAVNQPAPGEPDPEAQAKMAKVAGDLQLKAAKNAGDLELKKQKQEQQMKLKDLQVAQTMRQKERVTATDLQTKGVQTAVEMQNKAMQAAHDMNLKTAAAAHSAKLAAATASKKKED